MKVTMLYFSTIAKLIEENGYTWDDVNAINDNEKRVTYGKNGEYASSLEDMFYASHMGGNWTNYHYKQNIIDAFVMALEEAKTRTQ